ncbi:alpha/beta fold hydrolase [Streptomyces sp. NPDC050315]|uniref:alpha/beta fold hydrolase n=1 Tax=Streptomyces sp. NPDC050315 TaxID=3155039 RepID=UPI0034384B53
MTSSPLRTAVIAGHPLTFDVHGSAENPTVVLLSGWCQDHRLFDPLLPHLADTHHVIRIDWRGHGEDRSPVADFGYREQADDVIAVLDELGIGTFLPVSTSHGGWANVEIADRLGTARVPRSLVIDWIMTPAAPEFLAGLEASQDPEHWTEARQSLFDVWLAGSSHEIVRHHLEKEMAAFDYEMWARSCRVIADAYGRWDSPLQRMQAMSEHRPMRHLFSQPSAPEYVQAQADFQAAHSWFSYRQVRGETHFPTLDSPGVVAEEIRSCTSSSAV